MSRAGFIGELDDVLDAEALRGADHADLRLAEAGLVAGEQEEAAGTAEAYRYTVLMSG